MNATNSILGSVNNIPAFLFSNPISKVEPQVIKTLMTMSPRTYQSQAITTITSKFSTESSRVVLAAATGSGKTEMAIMLIDSFVKSNNAKVLVIAHHTNIIKDNFCDRLREVNPDFSWSQDSTDVDCFVAIRQGIKSIDLSQFSLVIVDEAHQNYFADTIQSRIGVIKHQVLLTATPSKFVADGSFDILAVARLDIPNEFYARLNFQIVNADNKLETDDYNQDGVVKSSFVFTIKEMKAAVDSVMSYIKDGKKLFICRDINQANVTAKYLTTLGVETFVSDSQSDADGSIADKFKSGQIQSLVVVDRMRLGYSDNNLYYTVDLTFTHNADTIHQMMSRSNRGTQLQSKYYIKVTNDRLNFLTRVIVSASIALMKRENLLAYNGKNFKGIQVPAQRQKSSSPSKKRLTNPSTVTIPDFGDVQNFFDATDFVDADSILSQLKYSKRTKHTLESVLEESKAYDSYQALAQARKTLTYFLADYGHEAEFLAIKGWSKKKTPVTITDEMIFETAKAYDKPTDFAKNHQTLYAAARKRGLVVIYKSGLTAEQIKAQRAADSKEKTKEYKAVKSKEWRENNREKYREYSKNYKAKARASKQL
jgi:hypothetical protein